jgi:hypothetical protein
VIEITGFYRRAKRAISSGLAWIGRFVGRVGTRRSTKSLIERYCWLRIELLLDGNNGFRINGVVDTDVSGHVFRTGISVSSARAM